ncbi:cytochrome b [Vibrio sonorensis]|uniref:cytochrome b n=1 Tax=Vibrio sonorensis TaxID=1004316 RepID=UPI0008DAA2BC|nr:cytochrome b [Vibrio sonorensis]
MLSKHTLSRQTIALHWLTALSFIAIFALGLYVVDLPRGPEKGQLIGLHKSLGTIFLFLAMIRAIWRLKEGAISPAAIAPVWQQVIAKFVQFILLIATLAMPISGIAMSVGGGRGLDIFGVDIVSTTTKTPWLQELGSTIHHSAVTIIMTVLALHIIGAIKHHLIDKDATLTRMLGR